MLKNIRGKLNTPQEKEKNNKKKSKGFTLVELIVVVVILAIIIGVTIAGIYKYVQQSRVNTDINNASAMSKVIGTLQTDKEVNKSLNEGDEYIVTWTDEQQFQDNTFKSKNTTGQDATITGSSTIIPSKINELLSNDLPESKSGAGFTIKIYKELDEVKTKVTTSADSSSGNTGDDTSSEPETPVTLEPGLYTEDGKTLKIPWDDLLADGILHVEDGVLTTNFEYSGGVMSLRSVEENEVMPSSITTSNSSSDTLTGKLILSSDITQIGLYAFAECSNLTSVNISNNVKLIYPLAFYNCTGLTSVDIPDSVEIIEAGAFSGCTSLTSVDIPDSVITIGQCVFYECTALTSIIIPSSVTSIGEGAFESCTSLSVTIPDTVTTINDYAFYDVPHIYYNGTATGSPWDAKAIN